MKTMRFTLILLCIAMTRIAAHSGADSTAYSTHFVRSKDGTQIGYRQYGHGPGLVLVQGAMGTVANYDQLANSLAQTFTVYVPERRGRGLSPRAYTPDHNVGRDVEDLKALLEETGALWVFGLSSGAIITLEAARTLPAIEKIALYEPPFYAGSPVPRKEINRVYDEIEQGRTADAVISAFRVVKVAPAFFTILPRFVLRPLTTAFLNSEEKKSTGIYTPTRALIPTMRYDFSVVLSQGDKLATYHTVAKPTLLLGGSKSPAYLKEALKALAQTLPSVRRLEFKGLDHSAPWNTDRGGSPQTIAGALPEFFLTGNAWTNRNNKQPAPRLITLCS